MPGKVIYNRDEKFDLQLEQALIDERRLGEIFEHGSIERIELKSESWQWERTGNIAVEIRKGNGEPSGLSVTKATYWVHELKRDGKPLCYLMFPIERFKQLCREAYWAGRRARGGDGGRFEVVLLRLRDILR